MFFRRLLRQWQDRHPAVEPANLPSTETTSGPAAAPAAPAPQARLAKPAAAAWTQAAEPAPGVDAFSGTPKPLWTQAELNTLLNRLREEEDKLLASTQAVEQEISAVLSEYAAARAGTSPEVQRRLERRYQRLKQRRSSLDQLHAEQLQVYRLLDHVEADLLRQGLAGSATHDTVLGMPLARLRDTLELSVARSGHRYAQLRDTVEGLDSYHQDQVLAEHLGVADVRAEMNALTEAEYQHNQAQALGEPEAWALAAAAMPVPAGFAGAAAPHGSVGAGGPGGPASPAVPAAPAGPAAPPASRWQAPPPGVGMPRSMPTPAPMPVATITRKPSGRGA